MYRGSGLGSNPIAFITTIVKQSENTRQDEGSDKRILSGILDNASAVDGEVSWRNPSVAVHRGRLIGLRP